MDNKSTILEIRASEKALGEVLGERGSYGIGLGVSYLQYFFTQSVASLSPNDDADRQLAQAFE